MKKPEFPTPRLIREDFLPEQDSLMNYRIKKITKPDGEIWYYPQKKILWFWWNIGDGYYGVYRTYELANNEIVEDYYKIQKDKVEILPPTTLKTVPKPPHNFIQR